ncbi:MAG: hydantoinase/oxoprolinase family protein [Pseudomonadota bacterium]
MRMAIDIGGTFTDTVLMDGQARIIATAKTPTTPHSPEEGALAGACHVLSEAKAKWADVAGLVHGTTLATNALIERRGARVSTITTHGFRDILEIAYERRYSQYSINLEKPDLIVPRSRSFTIAGRMDVKGNELAPLDEAAIDDLISDLEASETQAVAICLLHSYANSAHEIRLKELIEARMPDLTISVSHEVSPEAREFDRLCTTLANAYVQPLMATYLSEFEEGFAQKGLNCPILLVTAGGGMTTVETARRLPIRFVESGPAGGAILAARIARASRETDVLSFDMGGTTAKLCLIDDYRPQTARKFEVSRADRFIKGSGMPVRIPVVEMIEIGAGGGSIASVDKLGRVKVGPESAGADPGPAAFGKGGRNATVTDADIVQGYIDPDRFAEGRLRVDAGKAKKVVGSDLGEPLQLSEIEAANAISEIVDESMAAAGRMHAVESGKDLETRLMIAFGGNGPLHATRVARKTNVGRILVPKNPGVGSAVGFLHAPISFEVIRSNYRTLDDLDVEALNAFLGEMEEEAVTVVRAGAPDSGLTRRRVAFMRYHGQGHEIEVDLPDHPLTGSDIDPLRAAFETEYRRIFSRAVPGMTIEILNWGLTISTPSKTVSEAPKPVSPRRITSKESRDIICDLTGQPTTAAIFDRADLQPGNLIVGPALIVEPQTTTLVSVDFEAVIDGDEAIRLSRIKEPKS